jgi:hypothetical protein
MNHGNTCVDMAARSIRAKTLTDLLNPARRLRHPLLGLMLLASLSLGACNAFAAQDKASRSALIVGVGTYSVPTIPALGGVAMDMVSARAIAREMGIAGDRITVLRDAQATKQGVLDALEQLAAQTTPGGRVFIYFSGHGTRWFEAASGGCKEGLLTYDY